jgi:two-component system CheB/CheR fusion protein
MEPTRVVGVGASAGGLEAFSRLFAALPERSGLAYLLVPHLSPTHPSELTQLMARVARFPVKLAADDDRLEPDRLYVLPPDRVLEIVDGHIRLSARPAREGAPTVIDACFTSLAETWGERAVGVVLSGNGSDGTAGLKAIKAAGGRTYAQDFVSAAYDGMPRSAVLAGAVDAALPPEGIAHALVSGEPDETARARPAKEAPAAPDHADIDAQAEPPLAVEEVPELEAILGLLHAFSGVDFRGYKRPSIVRRVRRRMAQVGVSDLATYRQVVAESPTEVQVLFNGILIHVTEFFRDPDTFEVLQAAVLPTLFANRADTAPLRVWVVGCASGEEAYSVAIAIAEAGDARGRQLSARIFATDLSEPVLAAARLGRYPAEIAADVSPERLARFFVPVEGGYQIQKRIRDMVVFARQDVTRDPPYAQLDLVLCRNVLIYLDPVLQRRALHVFHYALGASGFLMLGPAESIAGMESLFSPVDRIRRVFLRKPVPARLPLELGWSGQQRSLPSRAPPAPGVPALPWTDAELQQRAALALFAEGATGSVVVNGDLEIRHFQGQVSPYLEPPTGGPTVHLLRMAHPELRLILGRLIRKAQKTGRMASRRDVDIAAGARRYRLTVRVLPFPTDETLGEHYLVLFDSLDGSRRGDPPRGAAPAATGDESALDDPGRLQVEQELADTKDYLQAIIDQQDETHAELQAAYEASRSANEEFQSTNEELESTKEELQAVNEELNTLNEQLQQRNAELTARAAEVNGLLEALEIPLFVLTPELRLQAFNAKAAAVLELTRDQVGRQGTDLPWPLPTRELRQLAGEVLAGRGLREVEVQDPRGHWFVLRLWPVVPAEGAPAGVLGALIDIAHLHRNLEDAHQARAFSEAIVDGIRVPLLVLDHDQRVLTANHAYRATFGAESEPASGAALWELGGRVWDRPEVRALLEGVGRSRHTQAPVALEIDLPGRGHRFLELTAHALVEPGTGARHLLLAVEDFTARKRLEQRIVVASRMQAVGQLAGGVAHEINNQMTAVLGFTDLLATSGELGAGARHELEYITKAGRRAAEVAQQLLAFGRRQTLRPVVAELNALVAGTQGLLMQLVGPELELVLTLGKEVGHVRLDQAQLEQLLVNLVLNARDATGPGGRLTIETAAVVVDESTESRDERAQVPRGAYARLIVSDTGTGMDRVTLGHIFEPFFTTKPQGRGTGLGLASVYGLVKQSGGFVWVDSEPGRGTTFTMDFPCVAAEPPTKPRVSMPEVAGGTETILVVEDDAAVRTWARGALEQLGYVVLEAEDGLDALDVFATRGEEVALVLADVVMGRMGGGELRDRLGAQAPGVPVLLMSGHGPEELLGRGFVGDNDELLHKPFDIAHLDRRIRTLLGRGSPARS